MTFGGLPTRWEPPGPSRGVALVVPTRWHDAVCYRVCLVNPLTTAEMLSDLLDDMAAYRAS